MKIVLGDDEKFNPKEVPKCTEEVKIIETKEMGKKEAKK
jgi:hypothetical protein